MHQLQIQSCTSCSFLPLRSATPRLARPHVHGTNANRLGVRAQVWTQVTDQASGKPYYWNTFTDETSWEWPAKLVIFESSPPTTRKPAPPPTSAGVQQQQQQEKPSMSNDALFDILAAAYAADSSGEQFWEVARVHRIYGTFEQPFIDYLMKRMKPRRRKAAAGDADDDD